MKKVVKKSQNDSLVVIISLILIFVFSLIAYNINNENLRSSPLSDAGLDLPDYDPFTYALIGGVIIILIIFIVLIFYYNYILRK